LAMTAALFVFGLIPDLKNVSGTRPNSAHAGFYKNSNERR